MAPAELLLRLLNELQAALDLNPVTTRSRFHQVVQDVVGQFPACVLVADDSGQLVAASEQTLQTLGYTLQSIRELSVTDLAAESEQTEVERLWESFQQQRRQSGCFLLRHRDGTVIQTAYAAATNAVGGLSAAVHVIQPGESDDPLHDPTAIIRPDAGWRVR